jgi:hypothetical protein
VSVIVMLRVSGGPATSEQATAAHADAIGRIMDVAKRHGLIAHRWCGADGQYMAVDEWPDADRFNAFFNGAQPDRPGHAGCRGDLSTGSDVLAHARHRGRRRLGGLTSEAARSMNRLSRSHGALEARARGAPRMALKPWLDCGRLAQAPAGRICTVIRNLSYARRTLCAAS